MPRSFLVKKYDEIRTYHSYKPRSTDNSAVIIPDITYGIAPYTPALDAPLSVNISNGYIQDILSPFVPHENVHREIENARGCEDACIENKKGIKNGIIDEEILRKFQHNKAPSSITIEYTYDALLVSDGRTSATHLAENSGKHRYTCNECCKDYATSSNLSRHKQTHRSLDSHLAKRCQHCGKTYVSMPALSMHLLTHDLRHKCDVCNKSFSRPWLLQVHFRSHTGEKPYGCAHCGKAFADRSNLRVHMQTHSAYKSYNCKRCSKLFALKSYLNKHCESACLHDNMDLTDGGSECSEVSFSRHRKIE